MKTETPDSQYHNRAMGFTSYAEAYGSLSGLWELTRDVLVKNVQKELADDEALALIDNYSFRAKQIINSFREQQ